MLNSSAPTNRQLATSTSDEHQSGASGPGSSSSSGAVSKSTARVIAFYIPATFQRPERRWIPPEARGKLIEFPGRGKRKSA